MHFVVSDIHGHVEPFVRALQHAKLLDDDGTWCGGGASLTVLGDFFDRGPDGIAVVDLIRRLQDEAGMAGGQVGALLGNHEILALGMHRFGDQLVRALFGGHRSFARSWSLNGGRVGDQERLTDQHIAWIAGLDAIVLADRDLLLHSDTTEYLRWGDSFERINDAVRDVLVGDNLDQWWECWVRLTARYAFANSDGERVAVGLLGQLGGERIVHGHSIIASLTGQDSTEVTGPLPYAGGRALAIDGGIYAGGPCLVVRLDHDRTATT
jgi:hypothetical protein